MSQIKSRFHMSINQNLSKNLRDILEKVEYLLDKISFDEKIIHLVDKNEWAVTYTKGGIKFLIITLYAVIGFITSAIIDKAWWINLIGVFITLTVIEVFITGPILKGKAEERIKKNEKELKNLEYEFDDLIDQQLLPEIYPLGMMTAKNIIDKTSARYLPIECVEDFMDKEVRRGNFEKIKLNNDILFKSKNPKFLSNVKTVVLEID
jgi:hypothetical protein